MVAGHEFWTDTIKRLKKTGKNREIVAVSRENLPLPEAFNEMAIALRKLIRARRREKEPHNDLLKRLYRAAVWQNFFADIDCGLMEQADTCRVAGQFIPRIKCDYNLIGYEHLDMLGVNDVKWMVAAWGEPKHHNLARKINLALYAQTAARYKLEKEREQRSAGRLFAGQQLKLTGSQFSGDAEGEQDATGPDGPQPLSSGSGSRRRTHIAIFTVIVAVLMLVILFCL